MITVTIHVPLCRHMGHFPVTLCIQCLITEGEMDWKPIIANFNQAPTVSHCTRNYLLNYFCIVLAHEYLGQLHEAQIWHCSLSQAMVSATLPTETLPWSAAYLSEWCWSSPLLASSRAPATVSSWLSWGLAALTMMVHFSSTINILPFLTFCKHKFFQLFE